MGTKGWWAYSQRARACVQCLVLAFFCLLPWAHSVGWTGMQGSFFALDVYGLPFADPLSLGQTLLLGSISAPPLWWGAGVTLVIALLFGRVFCGWLCPYGLFSEWVWRLRRGQNREQDSAAHGPCARYFGGALVSRALVLLAAAVASVCWSFPVLLMLSMPGALSLLPTKFWYWGAVTGLYGLLALPVLTLLLELLTGRRLWCLWLCPQSVLLSGVAALGAKFCSRLWAVRWQGKACTCAHGARPCAQMCSLHLQIRKKGGPDRSECLQCGACVAACRTKGQGALSQRMLG